MHDLKNNFVEFSLTPDGSSMAFHQHMSETLFMGVVTWCSNKFRKQQAQFTIR